MTDKKLPFNLNQLFAGFCPPSSVDKFQIVGDFDALDMKLVPSLEVDSPVRRLKEVEDSPKSPVPEPTTPKENDKNAMREPPKDIPAHTIETPLITADATTCEMKDESPSTEENTTPKTSSSNQSRLQLMAMISVLLLLILVIFNRSKIEFITYDARLSLGDKGGASAYFDPFIASVASKSGPKVTNETLSDSRGETPPDKVDEKSSKLESSMEEIRNEHVAKTASLTPHKDITQDDSSNTSSHGTSISSQEIDELSEAQPGESVETPLKLDDNIGDEDPDQKGPKPTGQNEKRIQFFKLERDETGPYLVSCEKLFVHDTVDTPPTFACSKTK